MKKIILFSEQDYKSAKQRLKKENYIKGLFFKTIVWENLEKATLNDLYALENVVSSYRFGANFLTFDENKKNVGKNGLLDAIGLKINEKKGYTNKKGTSINQNKTQTTNSNKKSTSSSKEGYRFSGFKRTRGGSLDGRSLRGGAKRAREIDAQEKMFTNFTIFSSVPFIAALWYLSYVAAEVFILEPESIQNFYLDIWTWISILALLYILRGITRGSMHAIMSLVFGLFPVMLLSLIAFIGYLVRFF